MLYYSLFQLLYNFNFKISDLALSCNDFLNIYQFYTEIFAFLSPCVQDIYIFMYLYLENIDKQIKEIMPKIIIPRDKPGLMFGCFIPNIFLGIVLVCLFLWLVIVCTGILCMRNYI